MTRRRFYAPPSAFASGIESVGLDPDESRHLRNVLRLRPGEEVFVFDGHGREFRCVISSFERETAVLGVLEETAPATPESPLHLTIGIALLKGEKFDFVVQKVTELGVKEIIPVATKLADIRLRDDSDAFKRVNRWRRIALEAAKQSGRAFVPVVQKPVQFESIFTTDISGEKFMFSERDGISLEGTKTRCQSPVTKAIALVGSEGGWTDEEIDHARATGWQIITLGGRILRAETAAISIVVLLQHLYGDLK